MKLPLWNKIRANLDRYKRIAGCQDCGTKEGVMDFDHRDGEVKLFGLAQGRLHSLDEVWTEMNKCDIRCHGCHKRRHLILRYKDPAALVEQSEALKGRKVSPERRAKAWTPERRAAQAVRCLAMTKTRRDHDRTTT